MGILDTLPPELITLLTWLVMFVSASAVILIISIAFGKILGEFIESIWGWIR